MKDKDASAIEEVANAVSLAISTAVHHLSVLRTDQHAQSVIARELLRRSGEIRSDFPLAAAILENISLDLRKKPINPLGLRERLGGDD